MKKAFLILFIVTFYFNLSAQQTDTSWFRKSLSDFGPVYMGISNEMGDFHKTESYFWGFDLGFYLKPFKNSKNTHIKIGLASEWLDNSIMLDLQTSSRLLSYPVNLKFGGIKLGMLFFTDRLFVPSFDVLIASGDLRYQVPENVYATYANDIEKQTESIYIIAPKINLEVKLTQSLKFGWGFSYRYVQGIDVPWSSNVLASDFGYHGTFIANFGK
jgi:hypothetical protein